MLLAAVAVTLMAAGVALVWWMLNLPSSVRGPCSGEHITYITPEGTYCMVPNPLVQPWLPVATSLIGLALLVTAWRFDHRVGRVVHRGTTGLAHAFVPAALALPFVVLSSGSCGPSVELTGYQLLVGSDLPGGGSFQSYAPVHISGNPAIAVLLVVAVAGTVAAVWPRVVADMVRACTAALGIGAVAVAFALMPKVDYEGLTFDNNLGDGGLLILTVLTISLLIDGGVLLGRRARSRSPDVQVDPVLPLH